MVTRPSAPEEELNPLAVEAAVHAADSMAAEVAALDKAEEVAEAEPVVQAAPAPAPAAEVAPPATAGPELTAVLQRQLQEAQQRLQVYETQQREASFDTEQAQYQAQLESQGLEAEQAKPIAQQWRQLRQREQQVVETARLRELNTLGKFYAALHYAQTYGGDARELLQHDSPQAMEAAAKAQKEVRELKAQVQKLTQQQVAPSVLETGQTALISTRSDGQWLTAYNSGDRSPQAVAAARKAAGQ